MKTRSRFNKYEYLFYAILIILIFHAPTVSTLFHGHDIDDISFLWNDLLHSWKVMSVFVVAFAIHDVFLAPLLVYKHKTWHYLGAIVLLVTVFQLYQCTHRPLDNRPPLAKIERHVHSHGDSITHSHSDVAMPPPPHGKLKENLTTPPPPIQRHDIISFILLVFGLGTNIGVKFYVRSLEARKEMEELEKENLTQKLDHLRYQLRPHFFMNTLNNIHALVDIDPAKAKESIIDLSKLMRYVLYESNHEYVMAAKEVAFTENYVKLMRIRYGENLTFSITPPDDGLQVWLPPLVFISFVENAFKHGASPTKPSFIKIGGSIYTGNDGGTRLLWTCCNSKRKENGNNKVNEASGVGLSNIRRRLDLMFGDNYSLNINDDENEYLVEMDIPVMTSDPNTETTNS